MGKKPATRVKTPTLVDARGKLTAAGRRAVAEAVAFFTYGAMYVPYAESERTTPLQWEQYKAFFLQIIPEIGRVSAAKAMGAILPSVMWRAEPEGCGTVSVPEGAPFVWACPSGGTCGDWGFLSSVFERASADPLARCIGGGIKSFMEFMVDGGLASAPNGGTAPYRRSNEELISTMAGDGTGIIFNEALLVCAEWALTGYPDGLVDPVASSALFSIVLPSLARARAMWYDREPVASKWKSGAGDNEQALLLMRVVSEPFEKEDRHLAGVVKGRNALFAHCAIHGIPVSDVVPESHPSRLPLSYKRKRTWYRTATYVWGAYGARAFNGHEGLFAPVLMLLPDFDDDIRDRRQYPLDAEMVRLVVEEAGGIESVADKGFDGAGVNKKAFLRVSAKALAAIYPDGVNGRFFVHDPRRGLVLFQCDCTVHAV